jgi:uncharacterized protein (TIGR00369 family)
MKNRSLTVFRRKHLQKLLTTVPFPCLLGIQLKHIEFGCARLLLDVKDDFKQNDSVVHGGVIATLIDTATAFASLSVINPKERVATVDLTIKYLNSWTSGHAMASARVIKAGSRLLTISAEVRDERKTLIATALSTYVRILPRS